MQKIRPGVLAGLVAAALAAAPAGAAGPANVTVRVEGETHTLLPRTTVTTGTAPVAVEGTNSCSGTSALGALDKAVAGDYGGTWGAFGFQIETIKGEFHHDEFPADPARYWSFWVNYSFQNQGACDTELQEGDEVLLFVGCYSATNRCVDPTPLRLTGVPATVAPGQPLTLRLEEFTTRYDAGTQTTATLPEPAEGATVTAGAQTATTGADGTARLQLRGPGPVTITATKPGRVRTAAPTCVTNGADGACGSPPPCVSSGTDGRCGTRDTEAPIPSLIGLANGQVFRRREAPRELEGSVTADPSGLLSVRLSILRKLRGRCSAFRGETERFHRHRCGGWRSFKLGDRADWSYLLPRRLGRGRYTIRAVAIDKAGNVGVTRVVIRVR